MLVSAITLHGFTVVCSAHRAPGVPQAESTGDIPLPGALPPVAPWIHPQRASIGKGRAYRSTPNGSNRPDCELSSLSVSVDACLADTQVLTLTILFGWSSFVIALSQAGKSSPSAAFGDAVKGLGNLDMAGVSEGGMGVWGAMACGESADMVCEYEQGAHTQRRRCIL